MRIHKEFTGGNIKVVRQEENQVYLENELRDTEGDWFYWAFCAEGAQGKTITFCFEEKRLGYFGPAVSHDLRNWEWLGRKDGGTFTYTFSENEEKVYFAHHMLYHPDRFEEFCEARGQKIETLCMSKKGRNIPCVKFGSGEDWVILTARHHACESTGDYVLEGVLEELMRDTPKGFRVLCVPFMDFDGVVDGDQGKFRLPHDHNRDYNPDEEAVHASVGALRRFILENHVRFGFDFHSPWHLGGENDRCFIVQKLPDKVSDLNWFGELLENSITAQAFAYRHRDDHPYGVGWNRIGPPRAFAPFVMRKPEAELAFTLETAYFGTEDNVFGADKAKETGRCFVQALRNYIDEKGIKANAKGE